MAGARYRGRAAARRRHRPEVTDTAKAVREAHPGLIGEMGQGGAQPHLAGAALGRRPPVAQTVLWRGQAHGGRADARPS
jgi:hypothetical protein